MICHTPRGKGVFFFPFRVVCEREGVRAISEVCLKGCEERAVSFSARYFDFLMGGVVSLFRRLDFSLFSHFF